MPIFIDTDPGLDDALALAAAAAHRKLGICGVLSTYGNVPQPQAHKNACGLAALLKLTCPVLPGVCGPLDGSVPTFTDYHGSDGLCGIPLPPHTQTAEPDGGDPEMLCDRVVHLLEHHAPVTYIALGPLSNLAMLLQRRPAIKAMLSRVVIMGGGLEITNASHGAEYNFSRDGAAVQKVLSCGLPLVLAPLDATHPLALTEKDLAALCGQPPPKTPTSRAELIQALLYANLHTAVANGLEGAVLHDALPILYCLSPAVCTVRTLPLTADNHGALSVHPGGMPVSVIAAAERAAFIKMIEHTIKNA